MARFCLILAAAGRSERFGGGQRKKPFVELKGRPVWVRSVEHFINRDDVVQTLVAVSPDDREWFREKFAANLAFLDLEIVDGGAERADTVQNCLARVRADVDFVAVHDAARPLLATAWINRVFRAAEDHGAAIPAVPITSTIKRVSSHGTIAKTVSRAGLFAAQTPQVFARTVLLDAYARRDGHTATDEASLVEAMGHPVHVVEGSALNMKITTQEDLKIAEALLDLLPKEQAKFLHPFKDERVDLF